jgi:ABC-2 type transport system permease protein
MALDAAGRGRLRTLTFHQVLLLWRQPGPLIVYTVLPLLLMLVLQPLFGLVAASHGVPSASGTSQAAAGMAVMFSPFTLETVGASLLEERTWHTWDRLRNTPRRFLGNSAWQGRAALRRTACPANHPVQLCRRGARPAAA